MADQGPDALVTVEDRPPQGWSSLPCDRGAPSLLLNDGDHTLYGVFPRQGEADLYRLDGLKAALEGGRAGDLRCCQVPSGMERSPGAFFRNRVWLVGGSQIDSGVVSNRCWWFDPLKKEAAEVEARWTERMGHACAVSGQELWVIGGADRYGTALNDVWSYDGKDWTRREPLETALCQLTAADFDGRLWIYGGANAPLGRPQDGLSYRTAEGKWERVQFWIGDGMACDPGIGAPFGSALCARRRGDELVLSILGTFKERTTAVARSAMYTLVGWKGSPAVVLEEHPDPIAEGEGWPTRAGSAHTFQVHRLSATRFGSLVLVLSLVRGVDARALTCFRPRVRARPPS